uniref:Uncharacterized protein n=1 Tax=Chlamydomonas leiostraca TaxID=1034604 RepID=A0A7S0WU00_9CHLO
MLQRQQPGTGQGEKKGHTCGMDESASRCVERGTCDAGAVGCGRCLMRTGSRCQEISTYGDLWGIKVGGMGLPCMFGLVVLLYLELYSGTCVYLFLLAVMLGS